MSEQLTSKVKVVERWQPPDGVLLSRSSVGLFVAYEDYARLLKRSHESTKPTDAPRAYIIPVANEVKAAAIAATLNAHAIPFSEYLQAGGKCVAPWLHVEGCACIADEPRECIHPFARLGIDADGVMWCVECLKKPLVIPVPFGDPEPPVAAPTMQSVLIEAELLGEASKFIEGFALSGESGLIRQQAALKWLRKYRAALPPETKPAAKKCAKSPCGECGYDDGKGKCIWCGEPHPAETEAMRESR